MKLEVFERLSEQATKFGPGRPRALQEFLPHPLVMHLGWPDDVVEQWLFDHASHPAFHIDYGHIDLETLDWCRDAAKIAQTRQYAAYPPRRLKA
nr:hypothetical protein [Streptomyces incarnatus]